jgi:hypothetical protein
MEGKKLVDGTKLPTRYVSQGKNSISYVLLRSGYNTQYFLGPIYLAVYIHGTLRGTESAHQYACSISRAGVSQYTCSALGT